MRSPGAYATVQMMVRRVHLAGVLAALLAALAAVPARADLVHTGQMGTAGINTGNGTFSHVIGVGVAGGHVTGADEGYSKLEQFSTGGTFVRHQLAAGGSPWDLATDPDGTSFVLNSGATTGRVRVFDDTLAQTSSFDLPATGPSSHSTAYNGLGLDTANRSVLVADTVNSRVLKYSYAGVFQQAYAVAGDFRWTDVWDAAADPAGNVYVLTTGSRSIWEFRPDGALIRRVAITAVNPWSIAVDASANVYLLDNAIGAGATAGVVRVYTATGALTQAFGDGFLSDPMGIAVAADGTVYVGSTTHIDVFGGSLPPPPPPSCTRAGRTIGNVGVCADSITPAVTPGIYTAAGDVTLDGSVSVGAGPITLNDGLKEITSAGSVTVQINRSPPTEIAQGVLDVHAVPVTDPVSKRAGLAAMTVAGPFEPLIGGVPFVNNSIGSYLDAQDGGGVIYVAAPAFDALRAFAGAAPVGSLALGVHGSGGIRVLGGSFGFNAGTIVPGWRLSKLALTYASGTDSWGADGAFALPFVKDVSLLVSATARSRRFDSIDLTAQLGSTAAVPLGTTGIFLDTFGGRLSGLAGFTPVALTARVGGGWGKTGVPRPFNWILHIKDVSLTLSTAGTGTLAGGLAIVDLEGRLAKATASLTVALSPFLANGRLDVDINALLLRLRLGAGMAMDTHHFTAIGDASGTVFGRTLGRGRGVISDRGFGGTGRLCFLGSCTIIGVGISWANVVSWPPALDFIGADVDRYITIQPAASAAAGPRPIRFRVARGLPFLVVQGQGKGAGAFTLVSPAGRRYVAGRRYPDAYSQRTRDRKAGSLVVFRPAAGTWTLRPSAARDRFSVQQVPALGRITSATVSPRTTRTRRLASRTKSVLIRWRSRGLPRRTRVAVYVSRSRTVRGRRVPGKAVAARPLGAGGLRLSAARLRSGANYLTVVATDRGIPFQSLALAPVWKR